VSKTFKILYDNYFPFIGFPICLGIVWLLFDMPINIGALLGINLGYIYGFFNYRFGDFRVWNSLVVYERDE